MLIHNSRHIVIPGLPGLRVHTPRGGAAAVGWWVVAGVTCVAAYQAKGAASLAASYTNLAQPGTYDLTLKGSGLSWDTTNGWGTNFIGARFLKTGITPAVDGSWSLLARFVSSPGPYEIAVGNNVNADFRFGIGSGPYHAGWFCNGKTLIRNAAAASSGVYGVTTEPYLDGNDVGTLSGSITGTSDPIYIGGSYATALICSNAWSGYIQAVAIYSATLSAAEMATVSAAMAAL